MEGEGERERHESGRLVRSRVSYVLVGKPFFFNWEPFKELKAVERCE